MYNFLLTLFVEIGWLLLCWMWSEFPGIHIEAIQPAVPAPTAHVDYSEEAVEYEKKLVQVILHTCVDQDDCMLTSLLFCSVWVCSFCKYFCYYISPIFLSILYLFGYENKLRRQTDGWAANGRLIQQHVMLCSTPRDDQLFFWFIYGVYVNIHV